MRKKSTGYGIFLAILAAALYAVNPPFSKLLLSYVPSTMMAGLLYIGAGLCMGVIAVLRKAKNQPVSEGEKFTKSDLPFVLGMIFLDIVSPISLLFGLNMTAAANASLLNNFEIVATAGVALVIFKEAVSPRLWLGIAFVTVSCALLSFEDLSAFSFSIGSIFILLSAVLWGIENNCTRKLSEKDPLIIVLLKGIFCGGTSFVISVIIGERPQNLWSVFAVLGVGIVAYGLSIFVYVYAQRILGAARTGTYYAVAPFIGVTLSFIIFKEEPTLQFFIAFAIMAVGTWLSSSDEPIFKKK